MSDDAGLASFDRSVVTRFLGAYELQLVNEVSVAFDLRDRVLDSQPGLDVQVADALKDFPRRDWRDPAIAEVIVQRSGYLAAREQIVDSAD